jgi:prepilin-type N-terminal cleavage/methylation domain-containing protein
MRQNGQRAFTIIELLVVVSIIALLIGILLPAIGKARDRAHVTRSESNIRQLSVAHATYGADWRDSQWSTADYNLTNYGPTAVQALQAYEQLNGTPHPRLWLGFNECGYWFFNHGGASFYNLLVPIGFPGLEQYEGQAGFGMFRVMNLESFNQYVTGRFYDPVFFAPKDRIVTEAVGYCFDVPGAFCNPAGQDCNLGVASVFWSSYCLSPAALWNPDVMSRHGFNNPWTMPTGLRTPSSSQCRFPDLKTHMLEHHWLQFARRDCNPLMDGNYPGGCEPYYFNHWTESTPVTVFYDGHIEGVQVKRAHLDHMKAQSTVPQEVQEKGLWHTSTPFGANGYFHQYSHGSTAQYPANEKTSFHILTTDGIFGRDILPQ